MNYTNRLRQVVWLALGAFTFIACAKPEESKEAQLQNGTSAGSHDMEQSASNRGTASATFGEKSVSIDYGRPQLRGRDMLAQATEGMVWRIGMNEATEIKTEVDLKFGETVVPAGSYSLWMRKGGEDKWELLFNKKTGIWGHEHPPEEDLAAVPMTMATLPESVETFTIEVQSAEATKGAITAKWAKAALTAAFTVTATEAK